MMTRVTPQNLLMQSNWFGARPKEVTAAEKIEDEVKT
jgi:hypothetical protein